MTPIIEKLFSLEGKTVIATGATGGLGSEMCLALAAAGANLVVLHLSNDQAITELQNQVEKHGVGFRNYPCNLADSGALRAVFTHMWEDGVVPDVLLNCAGLNRRGKIEDITDEQIDLIFAVNQKACYVASQEFGKRLLELQRPGKIINIGSLTAFLAGVNVAAYAASKGAVVQMTKAFSNEWASKGIQVNCICPGYFETPLTVDLRRADGFEEHIIQRTPAGRWGKPFDLCGAAIFLASSASDYVSGTTIVVDGGILGR
ncbi:hypothetical protein CLAIMM_13638 [Cladophialophora immunda]|nr:hypothetical protein CLAIMM_13638 [Cladophialophora immunda]